MKKIIALILCLVMCLSLLVGCGKTETKPAADDAGKEPAKTDSTPAPAGPAHDSGDAVDTMPAEEGKNYMETVTYLMSDAVGVINPHSHAGDGASHTNTCRMIYDTLYYLKPDGTTEPMLATSYETEDNQTWIFHLRDDVYFHNGDKLCADDVVYTWESAIANPGTTAETNTWGRVESVKAIDDLTVEIKTPTPYNALLVNLGTEVGGILNKRAIEADPIGGYYIGTGAYKIAEFSSNDYIKFERNEDYWGELPPSKYQIWKSVPEASTRAIMIQNGTGQLGGITSTDIALFEGDDNFGIHQVVSSNSMAIMFNLADPILNDLNFRKAVAYALDREELAIFAMGALANPVYDGTMWGYDEPFKNESIKPIEKDVDKAKEFLAASNYAGEKIELSIMPSSKKLAEVIQQQLGELGINIEINQMDVPSFQAYTASTNNQAQMLISFCLMNPNPVDTYRGNFYPNASNNRMSYVNDEVTKLMDEAPATLGEDAQRELYYRLQELVTNDLPAIPIYWMTSAMAFPKGVGGVVTAPTSRYDFRYFHMVVD